MGVNATHAHQRNHPPDYLVSVTFNIQVVPSDAGKVRIID